jgi:hypothetical protein
MFEIEHTKQCDGYTEIKFVFQSEEGYFIPCYLWLPNDKKENMPLIICLQGHSSGSHISRGEIRFEKDKISIFERTSDYQCQAIKEGYATLSFDARDMGDAGHRTDGIPGCEWPTYTALLFGRTTIGERVFDCRRVIDMIEKHFDMIDKNRIAVMGSSGGGTATIYSAAIDERISFAMPSASLCTFLDSIVAMEHCVCNYVPNIALDFDMGDICGLIAPRKMLVVSGQNDPIFPDFGAKKAFDLAKKYYSVAGASDNCAWVKGPDGHRFYPSVAWPKFHEMFD